MTPRSGFTLIEVLAVLALAGLMAAVAVASLAGGWRAARLEDQVDRLIAFDAAARRRAQIAGVGSTLELDLRANEVRVASEGADGPPPLRLDRPFEIEAVRLPDETIRYDEVTIPLSADGRSPTYAVRIAGESGGRWVLFLGLTGRAMELDDEQAVRDIFDSLLAQ